ncbi:hypothetical protein [Alkalihalobacillus deserti]|uniref:hypothetical protein n=1 Tax=Alkalihalobacillus deserti TaxID=2879466 RepID=UPI001D145613|nr:hypothetical protein [Alkalihalobacillus deserti]
MFFSVDGFFSYSYLRRNGFEESILKSMPEEEVIKLNHLYCNDKDAAKEYFEQYY